MKITSKVLGFGLALSTWALATQCTPEVVDPNEEELITTVRVVFTDTQDANNTAVAEFQDLDGPDGGDAPTVTGATLSANATYSVVIEFLNESEDPSENITEEVEEEAEEHQVFYTPSSTLNFDFAYGDTDMDGNPIGLAGTATTGDASTGTLTVVLRHEPNKAAAGVADGDITNAGGESDVEVSFDIVIE